jgi:phosphate-selective porin OprO/OprP
MISGKVLVNPAVIPVHFEGGLVMATLLLTGETRTAYTRVDPLHPFNPCHPFACGGAWELVGRVSRLHVGDVVFAPGINQLANPATNSGGCTESTLGFNWYLNSWVRLQFNWEHAQFDEPIQLAPGPRGRLQHQDTLLSRLQIIF